jgi:hypothetical protein
MMGSSEISPNKGSPFIGDYILIFNKLIDLKPQSVKNKYVINYNNIFTWSV